MNCLARPLRAALAAPFLFGFALLVGATPVAHASTITVNSIADTSGDPNICTLRDAIIAANTNVAAGGCAAGSAYPAVDTIWIQRGRSYCLFNPCTFILASPLPQITEPVTIHGELNCVCITPVISGAYTYRVFDLGGVTVTIENVNIIRGNATGLADAGYGGAIRTSSNGTTLTVSNVYFSENHAQTRGGALYVPGGTVSISGSTFYSNTVDSYGGAIDQTGGVLIVTGSTLEGNSASDGGGIEVQSASDTRLTNVTISGNTARNNGGGISRIGTTYIFSMNNVTIAGNTADSDNSGFGNGGGIYRGGGTMTMANTVIAGNFDTPNNAGTGTIQPDCSWNPAGSGLTSYGHNLIGRNDGCAITVMGVGGDVVGTLASPVNPVLGMLAYNGGPTKTHALLPGSPAIDAGSPEVPGTLALGACVAADQRAVARPLGSRCDIGAFEAPVYARLYLPLIRR